MTSYRKITVNTVSLYLRSLICMLLALFSSRWVLRGLGEDDFGLFNVVGALMIFISFLNGVLSSSAARFFAYAIGQRDRRGVVELFNVSLAIHVAAAVILSGIGLLLGELFLPELITVPVERLPACRIVFRLSLLGTFFSMVSVPFLAMYNARQQLSELAMFAILNSTLIFLFALSLRWVSGDRLVYYASYIAGINILVVLAQCLRALICFAECRVVPRYCLVWSRFRGLLGFAFWQMFGNLGYVLSHYGTAILINRYFPLTVNAAYGISGQISGQANSLSNAMTSALAPAITTAAGGRDHREFVRLAFNSSRLGTLFSLLFAVPLIMEIEYVLGLWLGAYPQYTGALCRLILLAFIINRLTAGQISAINAHGRIALFQLLEGGIIILSLPLCWLCFALGSSVLALGVVLVGIQLPLCALRVWWAHYQSRLPIGRWLYRLVFPILGMLLLGIGSGCLLQQVLAPSLVRLLLFACLNGLIVVFLGGWWCFDPRERFHLYQFFLVRWRELGRNQHR